MDLAVIRATFHLPVAVQLLPNNLATWWRLHSVAARAAWWQQLGGDCLAGALWGRQRVGGPQRNGGGSLAAEQWRSGGGVSAAVATARRWQLGSGSAAAAEWWRRTA